MTLHNLAILHLLTNLCLVIFLCLLLISLYKIFLKKNYTSKRHHYYKIKKAKEIIVKLSTFEGELKNAKIIAYLRKIDPYVFEELLLSAFDNKGYKIKRNASYSGDGGLDGIFYDESGQPCYIQAKRYNKSISSAQIADFSSLLKSKKVKRGFFIHTGKTPVVTLAKYKSGHISIISGSKLVDLVLNNDISNLTVATRKN